MLCSVKNHTKGFPCAQISRRGSLISQQLKAFISMRLKYRCYIKHGEGVKVWGLNWLKDLRFLFLCSKRLPVTEGLWKVLPTAFSWMEFLRSWSQTPVPCAFFFSHGFLVPLYHFFVFLPPQSVNFVTGKKTSTEGKLWGKSGGFISTLWGYKRKNSWSQSNIHSAGIPCSALSEFVFIQVFHRIRSGSENNWSNQKKNAKK